jgi:molybdate transport system substrate-binding protein
LPTGIKNGETMDVCFMIRPALDEQIRQGKFLPDTRTDLVASRISVAVQVGMPKPDVSTVETRRNAPLAAKSVAFSEGASGIYITETLFPKLGIADQMKARSVQIKGKELVGTAIERGDAEFGLQQISELRAIQGIQYVGSLPQEVQKVMALHFTATESIFSYFEAMRAYLEQHGKPVALYSDKASVFHCNSGTTSGKPCV